MPRLNIPGWAVTAAATIIAGVTGVWTASRSYSDSIAKSDSAKVEATAAKIAVESLAKDVAAQGNSITRLNAQFDELLRGQSRIEVLVRDVSEKVK